MRHAFSSLFCFALCFAITACGGDDTTMTDTGTPPGDGGTDGGDVDAATAG